MKKEIVLASVLSIALTLSACSGGAGPSPSPESTSAPIESQVAAETVPESATQLSVKEFPLTQDGVIGSLNETLSSGGLAELSNPKESKGDSKDMGKYTAYTYSLGTGSALVLYVSDNTGNVLNFTVLTVASEITDEAMKYTSYLIGILEGGMAGDDADRIDDELGMDLDNLSKDAFSTASTSMSDFMYMVQDESIVFMITPV